MGPTVLRVRHRYGLLLLKTALGKMAAEEKYFFCKDMGLKVIEGKKVLHLPTFLHARPLPLHTSVNGCIGRSVEENVPEF